MSQVIQATSLVPHRFGPNRASNLLDARIGSIGQENGGAGGHQMPDTLYDLERVAISKADLDQHNRWLPTKNQSQRGRARFGFGNQKEPRFLANHGTHGCLRALRGTDNHHWNRPSVDGTRLPDDVRLLACRQSTR